MLKDLWVKSNDINTKEPLLDIALTFSYCIRSGEDGTRAGLGK